MPFFVAYKKHPFFLLPDTYGTPQLSHPNQNLQRTQTNRRNSTKPYIQRLLALFYQSVRELFLVLSRPQSSYLYIRPDIQSLRTLHFFLIFLPSFLSYYTQNDNYLAFSLAPQFFQKAHYILSNFTHLALITWLLFLYA